MPCLREPGELFDAQLDRAVRSQWFGASGAAAILGPAKSAKMGRVTADRVTLPLKSRPVWAKASVTGP
ncbi:hypothetical protein CHELA20_51560 [Hyphomicrobiales bacterium]|nr:hypothetical protein CHELA41_23454 [Hyphomicrobiales bacterium]CAH1676910.1 hypothetical protein CHELA20_51560 [Hyphomicrobiales bacterium]